MTLRKHPPGLSNHLVNLLMYPIECVGGEGYSSEWIKAQTCFGQCTFFNVIDEVVIMKVLKQLRMQEEDNLLAAKLHINCCLSI